MAFVQVEVVEPCHLLMRSSLHWIEQILIDSRYSRPKSTKIIQNPLTWNPIGTIWHNTPLHPSTSTRTSLPFFAPRREDHIFRLLTLCKESIKAQWLTHPIGSMYGIYANIWGILMVNVTIYSIHGSYGHVDPNVATFFGRSQVEDPQPFNLHQQCGAQGEAQHMGQHHPGSGRMV